MRVNALDHVNIFTEDMAGTTRFYADLLDLNVRNGPPPSKPEMVQWVYDDQNRPIFHINAKGAPQAFQRECPSGPTGPIHHVALSCSGKDEVIARLTARAAEFTVQGIPSIGLTQIFTHDPNGVLLELNFFGD